MKKVEWLLFGLVVIQYILFVADYYSGKDVRELLFMIVGLIVPMFCLIIISIKDSD